MRLTPRAAACLPALLLLVNCTAAPAPEAHRAATEPVSVPGRVPASVASHDLACLAEAVYFEARGTGERGETAVAHVVKNRAESPKFPGSICGVVTDGCQFSYRCDGRSDLLADPRSRASAFRIAEAVLAGAPDFTDGALFFHAAGMAPGWFGTRPRVGQFGGNVFYR